MDVEDGGSATRSFDDPTALLQDGEDMILLDLFESEGRGCLRGGLLPGRYKDIGIEFEQGAGREDDGSLEHILQLTDVARP